MTPKTITKAKRWAAQDRAVALDAAVQVVRQKMVNGGLAPRVTAVLLEQVRDKIDAEEAAGRKVFDVDGQGFGRVFNYTVTADENGRPRCDCGLWASKRHVAYGRPVCAHTIGLALEIEAQAYRVATGESLRGVVLLSDFISGRLAVRKEM